MKIDPTAVHTFIDQTLEDNRRMNKKVGTTHYQANKILSENEKIQMAIVENVAIPEPNKARDMFNNVLKKLNII